MTAEKRRPELRAAVYHRDHQAILALLRTRPWPGTALQLIGDGLIAALSKQSDSAAADLARDCVVELRGRGWVGDDELADELDALWATLLPSRCARHRSISRSWQRC